MTENRRLRTFIGVDVGFGGALAVISDGEPSVHDVPVVRVKRTEYMEAEMSTLVRTFAAGRYGVARAAIESQQAMPGQGRSSILRLGLGWGLWRAMFTAHGIAYELVTPTKWKREMGIPAGADKDASRLLAQRLFPSLIDELKRKKDHGRADSLLIAEWLRRREGR